MAYPSLSDIKVRLGLDGSDQDAFLTAALAAARGGVESYCGYQWERTLPVERTFSRVLMRGRGSRFQVGDPGLLSWTAAVGVRGSDSTLIEASDVTLDRYGGDGAGAYDVFTVAANYDYARITGVWGRGLVAPDEVSEAVMQVAIAIFTGGAGALADVGDGVDEVFDRVLVQFLLAGHRRYR